MTFFTYLYILLEARARKVMVQLISTGCTLAFFLLLLSGAVVLVIFLADHTEFLTICAFGHSVWHS